MEPEIRVVINTATDIVTARHRGRALASDLGFNGSELTIVATAISEVARNIVDHAIQGEIVLGRGQQSGKCGIVITARDRGPGICDVAQAMQYGYSTGKGLGVGLPGAKWLMDEFFIDTKIGEGTTVIMKKWLKRP